MCDGIIEAHILDYRVTDYQSGQGEEWVREGRLSGAGFQWYRGIRVQGSGGCLRAGKFTHCLATASFNIPRHKEEHASHCFLGCLAMAEGAGLAEAAKACGGVAIASGASAANVV